MPFGYVLSQAVELAHVRAVVDGEASAGQSDRAPLLGVEPVLHVTKERALAVVQVDTSDVGALVSQRNGDMDGGGRLAGTALFVSENNPVRCHGVSLVARPARWLLRGSERASTYTEAASAIANDPRF
ncbi:hypothetical protein NOVOSPHI9U_230008 [Novosphingobium sp. 9U]|nr:hypothetical protein NOVOSPHI9U_230008 [Novosphingobium sp. 9U]